VWAGAATVRGRRSNPPRPAPAARPGPSHLRP